MVKKLYYDLETTGLDHTKCAIHQFSGVLEVGGEVVETMDIRMRPFTNAMVSNKALEVCGVSVEQLRGYPTMEDGYRKILTILDKYVDKYNRNDKIFLVGYNNSKFDDLFFNNLFLRMGNKFFYSYFWGESLDVRVLAANKLKHRRNTLPNFKLGTVADVFGVVVEDDKLHDALYDVELTMEVYNRVAL